MQQLGMGINPIYAFQSGPPSLGFAAVIVSCPTVFCFVQEVSY